MSRQKKQKKNEALSSQRQDTTARFEQWRGGDSNELRLRLWREDRDGKTFTPERLEEIIDDMRVFVYARLDAEWKRTGKPPYDLVINVKLTS